MNTKNSPKLIKRFGYNVTANARKTASALVVTAVCFAVFAVASSYLVAKQTSDISREAFRDALRRTSVEGASRLQANGGRIDLSVVDPASVAGFVRTMRTTNVLDIVVAKTNGEIVYAETETPEEIPRETISAALTRGVFYKEFGQDSGTILDIYLPLRRGQDTFGVLKVSYDWTSQRNTVWLIIYWIWGGTLGAAFFVTLGLWLTFRILNRELRRRHRALTAVLERAPIGIYTITPDGYIDSFNPKMVELSGATTANDVIGLNVFELPSYRSAGLIDDIKKGLDGEIFDREIEYVSFTAGRRTWRHYRGAPIFMPDGKTVERLLLLVEDVSVQKELEQRNTDYAKTLEQYAWERTRQLGEAESRLKSVVEKAPIILWAVDENGVFTLSEGSGLVSLGLKPGQAVGQSAYALYEGNEPVLNMFKDLLAGKECSTSNIIGDRRFQVVASPIIKNGGRVEGATGVSIDVTDRYQAEQRFAAMVNNSADVITLLDGNANVTFTTPPSESVLGWKPEEMVGHPLAEFVHPDDWGRVHKEIDRAASEPGASVTITLRFRKKDGGYVDIESVGQNYLADPHVEGIVINSRDITERLKAEASLHNSLTAQEAMAGISANFIAQIDFTEAVRRTLQDIGKATGVDNVFYLKFRTDGPLIESGEWTAPERPPLLPHLEDAREGFKNFSEGIAKGSCISITDVNALPAAQEKAKDFLLRIGVLGLRLVPIADSSDSSISLIGAAVTSPSTDTNVCNSPVLNVAAEVMTGASQRRRALDTAKHQAEQQAAVAAYGEAIMNENDPKTIVVVAAAAVKRLLDADFVSILEYHEMTGDFLLTAGAGWDEAMYGDSVISGSGKSQAGFTVISHETTYSEDISSDTRFRPWEGLVTAEVVSSVSVIIGESHVPWGVLGCHFKRRRILTEADLGFLEAIAHLIGMGLRRADSEAKTVGLDRLKSKFVQVVSHQFRTPLSAVRWNLESILSGDAGAISPEVREFLRITYEANNEVIDRIRDLLTVLDIEERRVTLSPEPISVEGLLTSLVGERGKHFALKRVKLETVMPPTPLPSCRLDPERFRSALEKLLDNALDYTPPGGTVTVSASRSGDVIRITVADTGIGIPVAEQQRVFERFFRASNASTMKADASGLGLTIAKYFVEQHDGKLSFSSKEGEGTTFTMELPIK